MSEHYDDIAMSRYLEQVEPECLAAIGKCQLTDAECDKLYVGLMNDEDIHELAVSLYQECASLRAKLRDVTDMVRDHNYAPAWTWIGWFAAAGFALATAVALWGWR